MAEFPALPFWTDAYLSDTRDLTAAQHGAYLLLLMTAWRTKENGLPDDDSKLARWAAMDKRSFTKNKDIIMGYWCKIDGIWHQKRLDDERKRAEHNRNCQVQAGIASALKRKETQSRHVTTDVPTECQPPFTNKEKQVKESLKTSMFEASINFEDFWSKYPKQSRRGFALEAYRKAIEHTDHKKIMDGLNGFKFPNELKFCPRPEDWLNGECWLEGLKNETFELTEDERKEKYFKDTGKWLSIWGEMPKHLVKG